MSSRPYSAVVGSSSNHAGQSNTKTSSGSVQEKPPNSNTTTADSSSNAHPAHERRPPSPSHIPRTSSPEQEVYILTLSTDKVHHKALTDVRDKYFPKRLNKLEAHLTLFHALPGSKLEDLIVPALKEFAAEQSKFDLLASKVFKLNKGMAIGIPKEKGGDAARDVHAQLQNRWAEFLSPQDARRGWSAHYTVMNKVDDQKVIDQAFQELSSVWRGNWGEVTGLGLWLYHKGAWKHVKDYDFQ